MTSDAVIRPFRPADAAVAAELLVPLAAQDDPVTAASLLHRVRTVGPDDGAWWVTEVGGEVVGWAESERHLAVRSDDVQRVWVAVRPDHRRRGLGGRLFQLAEQRGLAGRVRSLRSWALTDEPEGARFLLARGFEHRRTEWVLALDPTMVDLSELPRRTQSAAAAGYRLAPLRDLLDRPEDLYRTFNAASVDVPRDVEHDGLAFDKWQLLTLGDPLLDPEGSFVVLAGEEPVAFAWLAVDRERGVAGNLMTGTLREHRHRGLARLAKLATVRTEII